ncbi:hypothetical protein LTR66_001452 [Elasticomyces elasticus]|nr:hypothetical protein LTR66_001452 [Elasticomyces elasticus]
MSVVGEVVGIISCVAAVVSAYRDGGAIVRKIKENRAARNAPPPTVLLEESLERAPKDIETEQERGIARFGRSFVLGDDVATFALQSIELELHRALLANLRQAVLDDQVIDFTLLLNTSDVGRDRTIRTLIDLRARLMQAVSIVELPATTSTSSASSPLSPTIPSRTFEQPPRKRIEAIPVAHVNSDPPDSHKRQTSSLLGIFRHRKSESNEDSGSSTQQSRNISSFWGTSPDSVPIQTAQHKPSGADASPGAESNKHDYSPSSPSYFLEGLEEDPSAVWRTESNRSLTPTATSLSTIAITPRNSSSYAPAQEHNQAPLQTFQTPGPNNNYLGFCKGAWKLQNGDNKALSKRTEFSSGWGSAEVPYLACSSSKCAFAGRLPPTKIDKVWESSKGIRFRWRFLAKSHVPQLKAENEQYAYSCQFCAFQGVETPVLFGTDTLLAHVQSHRSQQLGEVILFQTKCIANRLATDQEDFDINLLPLENNLHRKDSTVLSDTLLFGPGLSTPWAEGKDLTVRPNEPWK